MTPSPEAATAAATAAVFTSNPNSKHLDEQRPNYRAVVADGSRVLAESARLDKDLETDNNFARRNIMQKLRVFVTWISISYVYGAVTSTIGQLREIAASDKRKIFHAFKVSFTLVITALYTLFMHTDEFVGHNGIWALMTVVVIYEFTTGATYSKGLNRGMGTFFGGVLVLGICQLAEIGGVAGHIAVTCISLSIVGGLATFLRFVPKVKARYDYGVMIFILTFSLLIISTNSNQHPVDIALSRLYMITVGCSISLFTTAFIFPIWAGDELHGLVCTNFLKLAESLQDSVELYLDPKLESNLNNESATYKKYNSIFTSKSHEDALANFATWEPPHGKFQMRHPWGQYIKVGTALRHCSYTAMALHGCLTSKSKAPIELRRCFETKIQAVSKEINKVICEVANNMLNLQQSRPANELLADVNMAAFDLHKAIQQHATLFVNISLSDNVMRSKPHRVPTFDAENFIPWSGPLLMPSSTDDPGFLDRKDTNLVARSGPLTCTFNYNMESFESANNFSLATFVFLLLETSARLKQVVGTVEQLGTLAKFQSYTEPCPQHTIDIK